MEDYNKDNNNVVYISYTVEDAELINGPGWGSARLTMRTIRASSACSAETRHTAARDFGLQCDGCFRVSTVPSAA